MATTELTTTEQQYLEVLEARIKNGLKTFWMVGEALTEIRDKKLYRQNYKTFKEYCDKQWGFSSRRAEQFMASAQIMQDVKVALPAGDTIALETQKANQSSPLVDIKTEPGGKTFPPAENKMALATSDRSLIAQALPRVNERQMRELASVPRDQRAKIFEAAVKTAPNGKPTATHIKDVAKTVKANPKAKLDSIVKAHLAKPAPAHKSTGDALYRHEQRIAEELQAIQSQKLWRKVAESFEDYLDGLVERVKGEM